MRRLKKTNPRFEVILINKKPNKFRWKSCSSCNYEFKNEDYKIVTFKENFFIGNHKEIKYLCNHCTKNIDDDSLLQKYIHSNSFINFKRRRRSY